MSDYEIIKTAVLPVLYDLVGEYNLTADQAFMVGNRIVEELFTKGEIAEYLENILYRSNLSYFNRYRKES